MHVRMAYMHEHACRYACMYVQLLLYCNLLRCIVVSYCTISHCRR